MNASMFTMISLAKCSWMFFIIIIAFIVLIRVTIWKIILFFKDYILGGVFCMMLRQHVIFVLLWSKFIIYMKLLKVLSYCLLVAQNAYELLSSLISWVNPEELKNKEYRSIRWSPCMRRILHPSTLVWFITFLIQSHYKQANKEDKNLTIISFPWSKDHILVFLIFISWKTATWQLRTH